MHLTARLLEQFVVLVEEQHFGRAAERLSMRQPPLSQAIQRLERGLGVALLDRTDHAFRLTPAGRAFADDARRLLEQQAAAIDRARRAGEAAASRVRVGYVPSLGYSAVPRLVAVAAAELPGVRLDLAQGSSDAIAGRVRRGELDLALLRVPDAADGLRVRRVADERLALALPTGHRLAGGPTVALADLRDEPFVLPAPEAMPSLHRLVLAACDRAGFVPRARAHAADLPSMLAHVAAGACVGFVPERLDAPGAGLAVVPLRAPGDLLALPILVTHREPPGRPVARLLDLLARRPDALTGTAGHHASGDAPSGSQGRANPGANPE